uniref:Iron hydrogenase small subunit domain-containing protein n=1 Tax=Pyramimonas obovata TaxID=1411642 RepID=A0A7S0MTQ8_9CHLO|mmetsp:Transcript_13253/g.28127  ORF Transcript_13253/g.28127 Transcript_13253/m.28127 type:complete len:471 (+) Transcript_13253:156-1568(+)
MMNTLAHQQCLRAVHTQTHGPTRTTPQLCTTTVRARQPEQPVVTRTVAFASRRAASSCGEDVLRAAVRAARNTGLNKHATTTSALTDGAAKPAAAKPKKIEKDVQIVLDLLNDPTKVVVAQIAPAYFVAIAEMFDMEPGTLSRTKLVAGLKKIGFKQVFDLRYTADLTIMEEASELMARVESGGPFPMITSCCPAWIKTCEKKFPELIPHLSSCKSPMSMCSSVIKNYWAKQEGIDAKDVVVVGLMPCTVKKQEAVRPQLSSEEHGADTDAVITTNESRTLFDERGFDPTDWATLDDAGDAGEFGSLGGGSGAGQIFGKTGGVMEAALRTAAAWTGAGPLPEEVTKELRSIEPVRKATVPLPGLDLNIGVFCGAKAMNAVCKEIVAGGDKDMHFIEIMNCEGGCMNGPGQPRIPKEELAGRLDSIMFRDEKATVRLSHENEAIKKLYKDFLEEPGSHTAHELLHTRYGEL